ncbi:MAG: hypothetical protein NZU63_11425, partial [Gemmataceae bacterium]|nr:hypothetical protein [Gemmataceae bacterium]MDW8243501.1 hypothetical protein [Thermogemmata sp.]
MRKGVLGSLAALAAGAGAAFGQATPAPMTSVGAPPAALSHSTAMPPNVAGSIIPPTSPSLVPAEPTGEPLVNPLAAPVYPPPGLYGVPRYELPADYLSGYGEAP